MKFIEFKASADNPPLVFSDDEDKITNDKWKISLMILINKGKA